MKILYIGNESGKYGAGIAEITNMVAKPTIDQIDAAASPAVVKDVLIIGGIVEVPFGSPNALVIDSTGEQPIVRAKEDYELLVDAKATAIEDLRRDTEARILKVCDSERQRSLSILYTGMSVEDKARVDAYTAWHKAMLAMHYIIKGSIAAAVSVEDIEAIIANLDVSFGDLEAAAPLADVDLASYVI